jgi:hypothetical protein
VADVEFVAVGHVLAEHERDAVGQDLLRGCLDRPDAHRVVL